MVICATHRTNGILISLQQHSLGLSRSTSLGQWTCCSSENPPRWRCLVSAQSNPGHAGPPLASFSLSFQVPEQTEWSERRGSMRLVSEQREFCYTIRRCLVMLHGLRNQITAWNVSPGPVMTLRLSDCSGPMPGIVALMRNGEMTQKHMTRWFEAGSRPQHFDIFQLRKR